MKALSKLCVAIYILLFTLMLVARDIVGISISKWLFVFVAGGLMFVGDLRAVVYMTAFSIPLLCGIPGTYILLIACVFLIFKIGKVCANTVALCALLLILEFIASIWYPRNDVIGMMSYMGHVAVLIILMSDDILIRKDVSSFGTVQAYMLGSLLLCSIIIVSGIKNAPGNWLELFAKGWFRFGDTQADASAGMVLTLNANNLGYYGILGSFFGFQLWRKGYHKIINMVLVLLHAIAGILSLSRSFLLLAALCALLMIIVSSKSMKMVVGLIFATIACGILLNIVVSKYPDLLTGWVTRMTGEDMSTGNGRITHLLAYLQAWLERPRCILLGAGVTGYKDVTGLYASMHNALEQILVCYGFVGATVFLFGLARPVIRIRSEHRIAFIDWIPLISLVLFVQTIQFVNPTMLMMPYAIAVHAAKIVPFNRKQYLA